MASISLPYNWAPRHYQEPFWEAMLRGCTRAVLIWHRRAGKDLTALNWAIFDMVTLHPGGSWWHVWPTYEQGRKFWEGADNTGRRYIDYIPKELIKRKREDMMMVELTNGSIYRVVGSDEPDKLVGANPIGLIMTEYALQNPAAWDYLRPILLANGGTAIFPTTPRGHNHAYDLYNRALTNDKWFVSRLGVDKTGAVPDSLIEEERNSGMSEDLIQQEYYCSFSAPLTGSYYADAMRKAEREGRITRVPYDPKLPVETWWDLGINDSMAIWFVQRLQDREIRLIDYEEGSDMGLVDPDHPRGGWLKVVKDKPYIYDGHIAPHDIEVRELTSRKSRRDIAQEHGFTFSVAPKLSFIEGVDAVRAVLHKCWWDADKCARGIEALKAHAKQWDDKKQIYSDKPLRNWAKHGADAFRTGVVGEIRRPNKNLRNRPAQVYDIFNGYRPYS